MYTLKFTSIVFRSHPSNRPSGPILPIRTGWHPSSARVPSASNSSYAFFLPPRLLRSNPMKLQIRWKGVQILHCLRFCYACCLEWEWGGVGVRGDHVLKKLPDSTRSWRPDVWFFLPDFESVRLPARQFLIIPVSIVPRACGNCEAFAFLVFLFKQRLVRFWHPLILIQ